MKTPIQFFIGALFLGALVSSCSVQKRQYRPGYEVTWNHHHKQAAAPARPATEPIADTGAVASKGPVQDLPAMDSNTQPERAPGVSPEAPPENHKKANSALPSENSGTTGLSASRDKKENDMFRSVIKQMGQLAGSGEGRVNGFAVASLVLGIVALVAYYGAFVLGVLAIIFGIIALNHIRRDGGRGRLMALAGLICGIIALAIIITIIMVAAAP